MKFVKIITYYFHPFCLHYVNKKALNNRRKADVKTKKAFLHGPWVFDIKTVDNNKLLIVFKLYLLKANLECILVLSWEE